MHLKMISSELEDLWFVTNFTLIGVGEFLWEWFLTGHFGSHLGKWSPIWICIVFSIFLLYYLSINIPFLSVLFILFLFLLSFLLPTSFISLLFFSSFHCQDFPWCHLNWFRLCSYSSCASGCVCVSASICVCFYFGISDCVFHFG